MQGNFTVFRHHKPFVFHYRGEGAFKPWILRPSMPQSEWDDPCSAFVDAFAQFEKDYRLATAPTTATSSIVVDDGDNNNDADDDDDDGDVNSAAS